MEYEYFDWAATSPMSDIALRAYADAARLFPGNPSASHALGQQAAEHLKQCRETMARNLGCLPGEVFFTSGGTESDSMILNSALMAVNPGNIIISRAEHAAIRQYERALKDRGWTVSYLPCPKGLADLNALKSMLNPQTRFVFVIMVSNILGTIEDLEGVVNVVREYEKTGGRRIHIHADAVQACGKIPIDFGSMGNDSLAVSAHKFCGPRGVGVLINRDASIRSISVGGGQESGLRPGTENLSGISAMCAALEDACANLGQNHQRLEALHHLAVTRLREGGFGILSPDDDSMPHSPYVLNVCTKGIPSEVFVRVMSDNGFCISAGSACNNNSKKKTEGLQDLGYSPAEAACSVRISFGYTTTEDSVVRLCSTMNQVRRQMRI